MPSTAAKAAKAAAPLPRDDAAAGCKLKVVSAMAPAATVAVARLVNVRMVRPLLVARFTCASGVDPAGYETPAHLVQREVKAAIEDVVGERLDGSRRGIDGCSIPTHAIPLLALARGFARLGTGHGLSQERRNAAARIRAAVAAHPLTVAGRGRFDTEVMSLLGARVFTKSGAEGVFCAALPEAGLGLAVKADDGAGRAAQVMIAVLIRRFGGFDDETTARLARFVSPRLLNWNGVEVGLLRPAGPLA